MYWTAFMKCWWFHIGPVDGPRCEVLYDGKFAGTCARCVRATFSLSMN